MMGLTPKQQECFDYVESHLKRGYCPSYQEIAEGLGLAAKSGVKRMIDALIERGYLRRLDHKDRALELVKPTRRSCCPHCGGKI